MRAIVTKEFRGTPDNATSERGIALGEVIYGELAKAAVAAGNAVVEGAAPPAKAASKPKAKA